MARSLRNALRVPDGTVDLDALDPRATPLAPGGKRQDRGGDGRRGRRARPPAGGALRGPAAGGPLLVVLQGMDTSGKGGVIEHVIGPVEPAGRAHPLVQAADRPGAAAPLPVAGPPGAAGAGDDRHLRPLALRGRADRPGARAGPARGRWRSGTARSRGSRPAWSTRGTRWSSASCTSRTTSSASGCWPGWPTRTSTGSSTRATWPSAPAGPTTSRRTGSRWSGARPTPRRGTRCPPTASGTATGRSAASCWRPSATWTRSIRRHTWMWSACAGGCSRRTNDRGKARPTPGSRAPGRRASLPPGASRWACLAGPVTTGWSRRCGPSGQCA